MAAANLKELLVEELKDIYDAEKQLVKALPKMAKAAESDELRAAFEEHLEITRMHVERLEEVFKHFGMAARGKTCEGMKGLIAEGQEAIEEMEGSTLDAALIAAAQKVEHYEIATYGTLATFADVLDLDEVKDLLGQNLEEEKEADEKLTGLAGQVNPDADTDEQEGEEREEGQEKGERQMAMAGRKGNGSSGRRSAPSRSRKR